MSGGMVERVGLAIQKAWNEEGPGNAPNWLPPIEFTDAELAHLARAAIEAMREPDDAMVERAMPWLSAWQHMRDWEKYKAIMAECSPSPATPTIGEPL